MNREGDWMEEGDASESAQHSWKDDDRYQNTVAHTKHSSALDEVSQLKFVT